MKVTYQIKLLVQVGIILHIATTRVEAVSHLHCVSLLCEELQMWFRVLLTLQQRPKPGWGNLGKTQPKPGL